MFRPRLTTVELPKYQVGFEAAELLLEKIVTPRRQGVVRKLMPELRVRDSCGFRLHLAKTHSEDSVSAVNPE